MSRLKNPSIWLHGLISAFISGTAVSIGCLIAEPATFNLEKGLVVTLKVALVSGIVSAAAYLKQSPLPPIIEDEKIIS